MRTFDDLFTELQIADESVRIEAKKATDVGKSFRFTVTAYSNEPGLGGGYFLLGVVKPQSDQPYEIIGVPDPDKLQRDIVAICASDFNSPIRPEVNVEVVAGKCVVIVRIPEAEPNEKPIFTRKEGLPHGACRRIGSADQHCTDDDVARLIQLRNENSYDATAVPDATFDDLDPVAIAEYRRTRLDDRAEELAYGDEDLLVALGAMRRRGNELFVTRAGLVLFGKESALRRISPSARVDYILVAGQDWVPDTTQPLKSTEVRQALILAVPRIARLVLQDLPTTFQIKGKNLRRKEIPAIPERVLREAVVNALMHRSYRAQKPIQIIRFSNRLEIRNPGHSLVSDEELGEPGSRTRNERIAAVLHDCGYAETKGTGIRVMRDQMRSANMTEPLFRSSRQQDSFEVTLLTHHLLDAETVQWLSRFSWLGLTDHEAKALVVAREVGYIDNSTYRRLNDVDVLTASTSLRRLRDIGLLDSHGKSTATYYSPTDAMLGRNPGVKPALKPGFKGKSPIAQPLQLTPELVGLLRRIGERAADPRLVELAILKLCAVRPLTLDEIAKYTRREQNYVRRKFVQKMLATGALQYLHPDAPAHPRQAYSSAPWMATLEIPEENKTAPKRKSKSQGSLF